MARSPGIKMGKMLQNENLSWGYKIFILLLKFFLKWIHGNGTVM